jgi:hypothetical protein
MLKSIFNFTRQATKWRRYFLKDFKGQQEVLVQWRGFSIEEATWKPSEVIKEDLPELYERFYAMNESSI